ncbi:NnrU family protein [Phreatobacter stygius]|uniref:NnrU family protein n=1 Tax=Phreatobacter stygius TaxID=1940610 RepID=A0A4D7B2Q2_9HYPH|nr:NnrU family protein [Phreatobacter stygius]QCI68039.1 NnrU family protein [Phreatobacter stygius]
MSILILGLVLFLGAHAFTTLRAPRAQLIEGLGAGGYKGAYSLVSGVGLGLIIYGYGVARAQGYVQVWSPPAALGHVTALLMAVAFIAAVASGGPNGKIKSTLKHPLLVAAKAWALGHLLVNGDLASMLLFGSFLAWAVAARISLKSRPDAVEPPPAPWGMSDVIAIGVGLALTVVFMIWLHPLLIGVPAMIR